MRKEDVCLKSWSESTLRIFRLHVNTSKPRHMSYDSRFGFASFKMRVSGASSRPSKGREG